MHSRFMLIAALAATITAPLGAEPVKAPVQTAAQPAERPAEILLASADSVRTPDQQGDPAAAQPVKRPRASRVSTCRCGGQDQPQR